MAEREPIRILVVDDEFSIVESLREILTWEGYEVETAPNGRAALEAVARTRPHIVLLDIMMPLLDGVATLRALRADPATRALPVVLMSAAPLRLNAEQAGFQAALRKPFDAATLLRTLRGLRAAAVERG